MTLPHLYYREAPVSVVPMAQLEVREPPVSLVSPVLVAHLDPR